MKILILGAGAVGGYFGSLLIDKGIPVTFLVREKRAAQLQAHGLKVNSPLGNLTVYPKVITSLKYTDDFQLVIISCKSYALDEALKLLTPLQRSTYVLPLLNGILHYRKLQDFFGKHWVLGGFAHLSTALDDDGNIIHLNNLQVLTLGALYPEQKDFIEYMRTRLSTAAPFIVFSNDIWAEIWKKLVYIATISAATCLMDDTLGAIASTPEGARHIAASFELNCRAAAFAGHEPDQEWKKEKLNELLDPKSTMTSSLLRSMRNGSPAELAILEDMLQKNREAGLYNELLEAGTGAVKLYESRHAASKLPI